jgi:ABC-type nitrate/sulfonate/bicarbonate transport system substrate-binding protein
MTRTLAIFAITAVVVVLKLASLVMAQNEPLRTFYYPPWNVSKLPMYLARETGVFERNGLRINWINPGSNEKLLAALQRGEADVAVVSANHVVQSNASGGAPMILVGNTGYNYSAFLAEASISRPADLKGKKIATGEPGSTPDQLTRLALRKIGIDPDKDVTMIHLEDRRGADRVKDLLAGHVAAAMVTPEALYELEKSGQIKRFNRLTDHRQLRIYAGGGADYAISAAVLTNRRDDAKRFMSAICEGIAIARKDTAKALDFVGKSGRNMDAAGIEYLYRLYIGDVIPMRPQLKPEGLDLAVQMTKALLPGADVPSAQRLADPRLVAELEKEGRCNF